ncbi:MAG TPA: gluconeogenesis factor YvcK family protein [Terriglobales bacterium]|nr:gluconeogenesis factor YvcK family protein [Terriglobales bacterium]
MKLPRVRVSGAVVRRWLQPGIGFKRWLVVVFVGELLLALAGALLLRQVYREYEFSGPGQTALYLLTMQFVPYWVRGVIVATAGMALFAYGSWRSVRVLMGPFLNSEGDQPLVEVIYQKRFLARGPKTVVIGGGTGLSTLLRGIKEHTSNITAVVTVADDGGSSGRLREELGIPAVGDIRNCIAALADSESLMTELLQYRFPGAAGASLGGHTIGNLLLAAMSSIQGDDFEEGVRQMNRVLAVRGQVVPATGTAVTLHARLLDGAEVTGQSEIAKSPKIDRIWLTPDDVAAGDDAIRAIDEADLVVIGPGSLYTSIMPSLLLPELFAAVRASAAVRLYICNVATQLGETQGYDLADHVGALERHTGPGWIDAVLANNQFGARRPGGYTAEPVKLRWPPATVHSETPLPRLVLDDVVDPDNAHHHDSARLAAAVMRVFERESFGRRHSRISRTA